MDKPLPDQSTEAPPPAGLSSFASTMNKPVESDSSAKNERDDTDEQKPDGKSQDGTSKPGETPADVSRSGDGTDATADDDNQEDGKKAAIEKLGKPKVDWSKLAKGFVDDNVFDNLDPAKLFPKPGDTFDASPPGDKASKKPTEPATDTAPNKPANTAGDTGSKETEEPESDTKSSASKSQDTLSKYFGSAVESIADLPKTVTKAADVSSWVPSMEKLLGSSKESKELSEEQKADNRTRDVAAQGVARLDGEGDRYLKQWQKSGPLEKVDSDAPAGEVRTHKNADGSSYTTKDGYINSFTTATGQTYSDIQYKDGVLSSYKNPFGQTHTRLSQPDSKGFATWGATDQHGRRVNYDGAGASQWLGKPEITDKGMSNLIGNGKYGGWKFSRDMDGTYTASRPEYRNGKFTGLDSTVQLPDGDQVSRKSTYENGKLTPDNANVRVHEADGSRSKVKIDEASKAEIVESKRPKEAGDFLSNLDKLSEADKKAIKNIDSITISDSKQLKGFSHVDVNLKNEVQMTVPNVSVPVRRRISATPTESKLEKHVEFDFQASDGLLKVRNADGMKGKANASGRVLFFNVDRNVSTNTNGYTLDSRSGTPVLTSHSTRDVGLTARHFQPGSRNAELLKSKENTDAVIDKVKQMDKLVSDLKVNQTSPGVFEGNVKFADKLPVNQKVPGKLGLPDMQATNLYFKDGKGADFKWNVDTGEMEIKGSMEVGLKVGDGKEFKMPVSKLVREVGPDGKASFRPEFSAPGDTSQEPKTAAVQPAEAPKETPLKADARPVPADQPLKQGSKNTNYGTGSHHFEYRPRRGLFRGRRH